MGKSKKKQANVIATFNVIEIGKRFGLNSPAIEPFTAKTSAKKLADAFNRELRAAKFKPKSAGRRARKKGHGFEREIAIQLREVFPGARRHLEYQDCEANGIDLVGTGLYRIQCKRLKKYAPISLIEEVQCDELMGDIPVLVTAGDSKPTMAVLPLADLIRLMRLEVETESV